MRYTGPQKIQEQIEVERPPKKPLVFYRTGGGHEPVREWLKELDVGDRRAVGLDLMRVQYAWPVGMPLCKGLERALGASLRARRRQDRARAVLLS